MINRFRDLTQTIANGCAPAEHRNSLPEEGRTGRTGQDKYITLSWLRNTSHSYVGMINFAKGWMAMCAQSPKTLLQSIRSIGKRSDLPAGQQT
jgi:hypothetical protein